MLFCVPVGSMQMTNLPKYDISLAVNPETIGPGGVVHVTSHVALIYYQMGTDPSVPNVYVEYELKGPSGPVSTGIASGKSDGQGYYRADITMPSAHGNYTLVARAYDIPGGSVNGENETYIGVRSATGATAAIPSATTAPIVSTPRPPTVAPATPGSVSGSPMLVTDTMVLLIVGAIILVMVLVALVVVALAVFLLRRKKKPGKPAAPIALPAPAPALPPAPGPEPPQRFCMHCGAAMGMEVASCPRCGMTPPSGVDTKQCGTCGTILPEAAKYCHKCGARQPETAK